MSELCKETLCTSCIHRDVCAIKDDLLKIFEMLPKHDDNFSLKVMIFLTMELKPVIHTGVRLIFRR